MREDMPRQQPIRRPRRAVVTAAGYRRPMLEAAELSPKRLRVLVLNQYYWPGVEATANLLTQLAEALADDYDVTVVTGCRQGACRPAREVRRERRKRLFASARRSSSGRASSRAWAQLRHVRPRNGLSTRVRAVAAGCGVLHDGSAGDREVSLVVARRFRRPLVVVSQGVFPEIAVELSRLETPRAGRVFAGWCRRLLPRAGRSARGDRGDDARAAGGEGRSA